MRDKETEETKAGIWLLEINDEMMSLVPMYSCSICGNSFSGYHPPDVCDCCGAKMKENLSEELTVDALNGGDPSSSVTESGLYEEIPTN